MERLTATENCPWFKYNNFITILKDDSVCICILILSIIYDYSQNSLFTIQMKAPNWILFCDHIQNGTKSFNIKVVQAILMLLVCVKCRQQFGLSGPNETKDLSMAHNLSRSCCEYSSE